MNQFIYFSSQLVQSVSYVSMMQMQKMGNPAKRTTLVLLKVILNLIVQALYVPIDKCVSLYKGDQRKHHHHEPPWYYA